MRIAFALILTLATLSPRTADAQEGGVRTDRPETRVLPLPRSESVWHFAIFGDRTGGPAAGIRVLEQGVRDVNLLDPDLVMTVGDLVQGYNTLEPWLAQMREYRSVMAGLRCAWYPVAGNHDVYWRGEGRPEGEHEASYEEHFGPLWYWFPHKNAAFVVLYSDEGDPEDGSKGFSRKRHIQFSERQLGWLKKTLEETKDYAHVFCFMHHPRWQDDYYVGANWDAVHALLAAAGNVTACFAGHTHRIRYDGERDGVAYHTLGATGGGIPREMPGAGWLHHYDVVTVRPDRISVAALPVGAAIDPKTLTRERHREMERLLAMTEIETLDALELSALLEGPDALRLRISNPCERPVEVSANLAGRGWSFFPDHLHVRLEPGESRELVFECALLPSSSNGEFEEPRLALRLEWVGPDLRVALPERDLPVETDYAGLAPPTKVPETDLALRIAGGTDCLRVPNGAVVLPDGPFTLEAMVRARSFGARQPLLAKTENSEFSIFANGGRPEFSVHLDGAYVSARAPKANLETGVWHHVAGVFDGAELRLYVDGRLVARREGRGKRTRNVLPFYVGADPNAAGLPVDALDGWIDEVRISKTARYSGEAFETPRRHRRDEDTVLLLHFDSRFGGAVLDVAGSDAGARLRGGARLEARP